ncbi:MAG: type II toxin-antitoxin system VapC family toxin [Terriglobales bacterium]
MRAAAFWDASALVPLCIRQKITPKAVALYNAYEAIIWWATPVEIASAIARLLRMKQINPSDFAKARKLAHNLADTWSVIQPSDALRSRAVQLVDRYDLRAADALQLVAALEWCDDAPQGRIFLTADERLREAALLSGFAAQQL